MSDTEQAYHLTQNRAGVLQIQSLHSVGSTEELFATFDRAVSAAENLPTRLGQRLRYIAHNPLSPEEALLVELFSNDEIGLRRLRREWNACRTPLQQVVDEAKNTFQQAFTQGGMFTALGEFIPMVTLRQQLDEGFLRKVEESGIETTTIAELAQELGITPQEVIDSLGIGANKRKRSRVTDDTKLVLLGSNVKDRIAFVREVGSAPRMHLTEPVSDNAKRQQGFTPRVKICFYSYMDFEKCLSRFLSQLYEKRDLSQVNMVIPLASMAKALVFNMYRQGTNATKEVFVGDVRYVGENRIVPNQFIVN